MAIFKHYARGVMEHLHYERFVVEAADAAEAAEKVAAAFEKKFPGVQALLGYGLPEEVDPETGQPHGTDLDDPGVGQARP